MRSVSDNGMSSSGENTAPEPGPAEEVPGREILIYVVDDESMVGEVVEVILKLKGFRPRLFTDPEAAYQLSVRNPNRTCSSRISS